MVFLAFVPELSVVERETRFELATACLEGRSSTAELLPLVRILIVGGVALLQQE